MINENVLTFPKAKVTVLGKTNLNHAEVRELRLLFDQLGETSVIAGDSLGREGPAPTPTGLQRVIELAAHLDVLIGRARQILD